MMVWTIFFAIAAFLVMRKVQRRMLDGRAAEVIASEDMRNYQFDAPLRNWSLALAHPMAFSSISGGFARDINGLAPELQAMLRPMALHQLELRSDLHDAQIANLVADALRQRWFTLDLQRLHASDDARAAMAFACARTAFFVRTAHLFGWLDEALQWEILGLNAQRAQQCFDSWEDFGAAYANGREQWIAEGRSDVLGREFGAIDAIAWTREKGHPWHEIHWKTALA